MATARTATATTPARRKASTLRVASPNGDATSSKQDAPTKWSTLWNDLSAQFAGGEVKRRSQAGRQFSYVTARTVMNRLDVVLGPENWWDEYQPIEHAVVCRLYVRLPDGQVLCKQDVGGNAGMSDQGDDEKSGFSDAFKRAAVKFGVGRYLYGDGVASHVEEEPVATGEVIDVEVVEETVTPAAPPAKVSTPPPAPKAAKDDKRPNWFAWLNNALKLAKMPANDYGPLLDELASRFKAHGMECPESGNHREIYKFIGDGFEEAYQHDPQGDSIRWYAEFATKFAINRTTR